MMIRATKYFKDIVSQYEKEKSIVIYSMWKGYLKNKPMIDFLNGINYKYAHTSGHATKEAIKAVCEAVKPKRAIIPIHSEAVERIKDLNILFPIEILKDGETYKI